MRPVPARRILAFPDVRTEMGTDTCPERGVILRVSVTGLRVENDRHYSYELEPEDALELAERLADTAHLVTVRRVMSS